MMSFTDAQAAAIFTHDRNLIVTAGAGSGKTRVLVERFVALLDAHADWPLSAIAAITFTEKAAREMRDRVRAAIEARAESAPEDERDRWFEHSAALNGARIGTIHALCAQLLRANPAEAGVDPGFEVLDENDAAVLLDDAIAAALAGLVTEGHPAAALLSAYEVRDVRGVLRHHAGAGVSEAVAGALADGPDALRDRWEAAWADEVRAAMESCAADGALRDALDWKPVTGWTRDDDRLMDNWHLIHAHREALLGGEVEPFAAAVTELARGINRSGGKQAAWGGSKEGVAECRAVLGIIQDWAKATHALIEQRPGDLDDAAAEWLQLWGAAIARTAAAYRALKAERGALDFDDLEAGARRLLLDDGVAARCQDEYRQVLVDEFQDTNAAQRDIIYRLCGADRDGGGGDGRLFVVGDPKQSIYAFRGADVSVFGAVREDLLRRGGREIALATSFRTHDRLVAAFNDLFAAILRVEAGPSAPYQVALGEPMRAHRPGEPDRCPHHARPVTVIGLKSPDDGEKLDAAALRQWEAWALAEHLHGLVADGALVWDRALDRAAPPDGASVPAWAADQARGGYRPARYGDVALLFQSMTNAPLYEDVFKAAGLPYVTVSGRGYFDRQEVWDLLHLLRALHNPADDLALATALRAPLFGLSDEALFALRLPRDGADGPMPLWQALRADDPPLLPAADVPALDFAREVLSELRDMAGRASIAELLTRALNRTGYLAALSGLADGARRRGNVEKLVQLARASGRIGLGAFNAYARDLTAREAREGEAAVALEDAVKLMTVHASKGLEFPIVGLADASWTHRGGAPTFTLDPVLGAACKLPKDDPDDERNPFAVDCAQRFAAQRDDAERRRLFYVAATRAADHLIVSGSLSRKGDSSWLRRLLAAFEIEVDDLAPGDEPIAIARAWGGCTLHIPATPPDPADLTPQAGSAGSGWDHPAVARGEAVPGVAPVRPPLLAPILAEPTAPARALSATQIARLGRAPFYDPQAHGWRAFRNAVLHDAPEPLRPLPDDSAPDRRLPRAVGDMVHRALRAWLLPGQTGDLARLTQRLRAYAWEGGLSDPALADEAIARALDLLRRFEASPVATRLSRASQVYRELPFVYHTGERAIHGVIDVLYLDDRARQWFVLDYKTALVGFGGVPENARRYYLQVGVYAAAVHARLGQAPVAQLYYVHPARLVTVKPEHWQQALARLEDDLRAALEVDPAD